MNFVHCATCPGHPKLTVIDSRPAVYGDTHTVRRRKRCPTCGDKVFTIEVPDDMGPELFAED